MPTAATLSLAGVLDAPNRLRERSRRGGGWNGSSVSEAQLDREKFVDGYFTSTIPVWDLE